MVPSLAKRALSSKAETFLSLISPLARIEPCLIGDPLRLELLGLGSEATVMTFKATSFDQQNCLRSLT